MTIDLLDYLEYVPTVPSGLRWTKQYGRITPGTTAGTLHKSKQYYVIQIGGVKHKCTDIISALLDDALSPQVT